MEKLLLRFAKYYWTFVASLFLRHNRPENRPDRILITRFDGLGDFFLLIPFLQKFVNDKIEVVIISPPLNKETIGHLNIPVTFIPFQNSSVKEFSKLLQYVRTNAFSHAFNLSMNIWGGFLVNQSKSMVKVGLLQEREGYVYKGATLFYDKILNYPSKTHNFDVLNNVFSEIQDSNPCKPEISVSSVPGEWIVIHPFATWKPRQWPGFASLIEALLGQEHKVKVIGTLKEHNSFTLPVQYQDNPVFSRVILSSVNELMSEIDQCKAFIGNDSGPAHYAALIGKPATVIWGPGFFERIHPVGTNVHFCISPADCRPCRQKGETCKNGESICLQNITTDMVIKSLEESLNHS